MCGMCAEKPPAEVPVDADRAGFAGSPEIREEFSVSKALRPEPVTQNRVVQRITTLAQAGGLGYATAIRSSQYAAR